MKSVPRKRSIRFGAGVLATLLAGSLLAPSGARASCGDYVVMASPAGGHDDAEPQAAHPGPALPADGHRPCSGPHCSQHAPPLPQAPAPAPPERPGEWGTLLALSLPATAQPIASLPDEPALHSVRRASTVYHPPR
jgi:hypothetical protein